MADAVSDRFHTDTAGEGKLEKEAKQTRMMEDKKLFDLLIPCTATMLFQMAVKLILIF